MVRHVGLEPTTFRLKAGYSKPIELVTHYLSIQYDSHTLLKAECIASRTWES